MDYNTLLELVVDLGYRLAMSGAETFRVEESITRILNAYGIEPEVFAIPNCLIVSIETAEGKPMTRMRRIGYHGNDLDSVERYSNLSRRICGEKPEPNVAYEWLKQTHQSRLNYRFPLRLAGGFIGASGYAVFFGGSILDFVCAGICGMVVGLISHVMEHLKVNQFFSTMACAFVMAFMAYAFGAVGFATRSDDVIIGTLMILLPGLLFTNGLRDIIFGDTNSGINRIVQVFLVAAAIALGTGAAWASANYIWTDLVSVQGNDYALWIQCIACFFGGIGFCLLFNIHGKGSILPPLGSAVTWAAYGLILELGGSVITASFGATIICTIYSEIMARFRKYPAISYLIMSVFPLIPGAGIYYTTKYISNGNMSDAASKGMETIAIAGAIAVGILMVSTLVRVLNVWKNRKHPILKH